MPRLIFLIFIAFLHACNQEGKSKPGDQQDNIKQNITDTSHGELTLTTRFNSFDTTVEVLFTDTRDSISDIQKKNYNNFITKQELLTPQILKKIFDFYKRSYADYKKGWTMNGGISDKELEKFLPTPTTPQNLKAFITPAIIHIQKKQDCKEGTIGLEFDCTWDIKNGLGVLIKNWEITEAGVAEITYF